MNIDLWFPSAISRSQCPFIHEIQEPYKKIIADYKYNNSGFCGERIHENDKFKRLNDWASKTNLQRFGTPLELSQKESIMPPCINPDKTPMFKPDCLAVINTSYLF